MLGSTLRAEREKKGLTIAAIAEETSIRDRYLEALEQGHYDKLPGEVYVKGFIRNYADFLGLDPAPLVQAYLEEVHGEGAVPVSSPVPETTSLVNERAPFSSGSDFHERVEKSHRKQVIFTLVATVLIAFVGSVYYFFGDDPEAKPPATPTRQTDHRTAQTPGPQPAKTPATAAAPTTQPSPGGVMSGSTASAAAGPVDLAAKFTARCWVQVEADGKTIYEGMAEANESKRWSGKESVVVTAGNAGAVEIVYNGQRFGVLGKIGEVVEKRFTKGKVEDVK